MQHKLIKQIMKSKTNFAVRAWQFKYAQLSEFIVSSKRADLTTFY